MRNIRRTLRGPSVLPQTRRTRLRYQFIQTDIHGRCIEFVLKRWKRHMSRFAHLSRCCFVLVAHSNGYSKDLSVCRRGDGATIRHQVWKIVRSPRSVDKIHCVRNWFTSCAQMRIPVPNLVYSLEKTRTKIMEEFRKKEVKTHTR
jgi:hypothetical protein